MDLHAVARRKLDGLLLGQREPLEPRLVREQEGSLLRRAVEAEVADRAAVLGKRDQPGLVGIVAVDEDEVSVGELAQRAKRVLHRRVDEGPLVAAALEATACTTWRVGWMTIMPLSTSGSCASTLSMPLSRLCSTTASCRARMLVSTKSDLPSSLKPARPTSR